MDTKEWIQHALTAGLPPGDGEADDTFGYLLRDESTGVSVREAVEQDAPVLAAIGSRAFHHAHAAVLHPVDLAGLASRFDESSIREQLADPDAR